MPRNVELKARASEPSAVFARALDLSDGPARRLLQTDVFFRMDPSRVPGEPEPRLKLRRFGGRDAKRGELILYRRSDDPDAVPSSYAVANCEDCNAMEVLLAGIHPVRGVVAKERLLLHAGETRIHLDRVEGLGDFVELEVVLEGGRDLDWGRRRADFLAEALGLGAADRCALAYIDMLEAGGIA